MNTSNTNPNPAILAPNGAITCPKNCKCKEKTSITRHAHTGKLCPRITTEQAKGFTYGGMYFVPWRKYRNGEANAYHNPDMFKPFKHQPKNWNYSQFFGKAHDNQAGYVNLYLVGGAIVAPAGDFLALYGYELDYMEEAARLYLENRIERYAQKFIAEHYGSARRLMDLTDRAMRNTFASCVQPLEYACYSLCRDAIKKKLWEHPGKIADNLRWIDGDGEALEYIQQMYFDFMDELEEETMEMYLQGCIISKWQFDAWFDRNWKG